MSTVPSGFTATLGFAFTDNLPRSIAFYRDLLGLAPVMELDSAALFHVTGTSYVGVSLKAPRAGGAIQEFVIEGQAAVDRWHSHLVDAGVTVDGAPRRYPAADAYDFFAEDPDANRLEFLCFDDATALDPNQ
ncbi:MAG: VOC family protein [Alphaproteobacteria bacterium]|jgi:catechol 2,3-dioxygenase-like lactoylglutathione lyase family enzyme|nr:VOC family protein [Rhodospirillaceae bacterium]MBT6206239.1 VOC family protein [Rhodospirillaceae bacterium]MBT6511001.1 VOC family protein [Rhodospirillaceae bacterium]MBT7612512.1 VOC family protein [Rhodospirillaceae bacterium]MDG2479408.1 VOC family protein [Alphaproteobacteria bacterium]